MFKILKGNGKTLTLQEASKITGLKVQTLRMRIKSGKLEAFKNPSKYGEAWVIKADNLKKIHDLDNGRLTVQSSSRLNPSEVNPSNSMSPSTPDVTLEAQKEHIGTLQRTLQNYEGLLAAFQQRITNLEHEKAGMEEKLKMLPAPPEIMASKITELEAELEQERRRSWWAKLWKR